MTGVESVLLYSSLFINLMYSYPHVSEAIVTLKKYYKKFKEN